jgi:hypothetical protein
MAAEGGPRRVRAGTVAALVVVVLLAAGGLAMARGDLPGGPAAGAGTAEVPTATAGLVRTDVVERQLVAGRLGYDGRFAVLGQGPSTGVDGRSPGVLTRLPAAGALVARGQVLYEVDGHPVPLWYGTRPAWRPLGLGVPDGADVRQAEANLVALGFDPARAVTVDRHFSSATARRWGAGRWPPACPGRARSRSAGWCSCQVAITTEASQDVLAAPITALLAEPGGGYAVALVEGGRRRLVRVATGLFDETTGLVEVAGQGLAEGATVEVPAP